MNITSNCIKNAIVFEEILWIIQVILTGNQQLSRQVLLLRKNVATNVGLVAESVNVNFL